MELDPQIEEYIFQHIDPENEILHELTRFTNLNVMHPRMLSGHLQGSILRMLCKMIKPKHILEIGTLTGYSSICLAQGLIEGGQVHTLEKNDEIVEIARTFIERMNLSSKITIHVGNALDLIPSFNQQFDLVYIDGEKSEYPGYYQLVIHKVRQGGFIIADNVLWNGKVLLEENQSDYFTKGIKQFNNIIQSDHRVEKIILPVRDGLMILRKK